MPTDPTTLEQDRARIATLVADAARVTDPETVATTDVEMLVARQAVCAQILQLATALGPLLPRPFNLGLEVRAPHPRPDAPGEAAGGLGRWRRALARTLGALGRGEGAPARRGLISDVLGKHTGPTRILGLGAVIGRPEQGPPWAGLQYLELHYTSDLAMRHARAEGLGEPGRWLDATAQTTRPGLSFSRRRGGVLDLDCAAVTLEDLLGLRATLEDRLRRALEAHARSAEVVRGVQEAAGRLRPGSGTSTRALGRP